SPDVTLDYWDYQARVTYDVTPRDRVAIFSFGASDYLGQKTATGEPETEFGTEFYRVDLRYDHRIDVDGTLRSAATLGLDRTRLDSGPSLRDRMTATRTELVYRVSRDALLRAGSDAQADSYDIELSAADLGPSGARVVSQFPSRTDITAGVRA